MDSAKTEEKKVGHKKSRHLQEVEKDRQSLEALKAVAQTDVDRPTLGMFFLLEVVKWGGVLFIAYTIVRFFFLS